MVRRARSRVLFSAVTIAALACVAVMVAFCIQAAEPTPPKKVIYENILPWSTNPSGAPAGIPGGVEAGNLFEGFGCANWSWGRYPRYKFAVSFTTQSGGDLTAFWMCWKTARGYGAGNLGTWNFELQTDAPQSHAPSGTIISQLTGMTGPPDGYYRLPLPRVRLNANTVYHLVMYNTDPSPEINWSSPNTIMSVPESPWRGNGVMSFNGLGWTAWGSIDNPCTPGKGSHSAYLLQYANGTVEGMPYYSATRRLIYGTRREGQQFPWSKDDCQVMQVAFPIFSVGQPAGGISYVLEDLQGGPSVSGTLPTTGMKIGVPQWCAATVSQALILKKGRTYRLYLKAPECASEINCYGIYVPYSSEQVPGWPDLTWEKTAGKHVMREQNWGSLGVPADMSFSLIVKAL
ncbi:MAG: hypothetical protein ACYC7E_13585 [Armatimonadota bacterium]